MFTLNLKHMATSPASMVSAYASFTTFMLLVRSVFKELKDLIPYKVRSYIYSKIMYYFFTPAPDHITLVINKNIDMALNEVYEKVEVYLGAKITTSEKRLVLSKTNKQKTVSLAIEKRGQVVMDTFDDIELQWRYRFREKESKNQQNSAGGAAAEKELDWFFELTFNEKHKAKVIDSYIPYVFAQADYIQQGERVLKLHCYGGRDYHYPPYKNCIDLVHPATFDTVAMDPELKKAILEDLDMFVERRELYKKVGKAWKRGYLLYGPPGTGKSSLIAAMANYLNFDIFDLELANINNDSELKKVLMTTTNRSILVIEDIDCSVCIDNRESTQPPKPSRSSYPDKKITLSGLLNFIDGLWSCCGDERIIVFTTNHKERLDPALLRPGRMDVHVHLSYCTPSAFRTLASNYLGIHKSNSHHLCAEIESLIESVEVTPAAVAGELMKSNDADVVLEGLVKFLKEKKAVDDKMKLEKAKTTRERGTKKEELEGTNKQEKQKRDEDVHKNS